MKHPIIDNQVEVDRVVARRGRLHAFETLEPRKSAFVVIDLMEASMVDNQRCRQLVPAVNELAALFRNSGGTVAWVTARSGDVTANDIAVFGEATARHFHERAQSNDALSKLPSDIDDHVDDVHVKKSGFSAFFPGKCDLDERLKARRIDTVVICGFVTNICCESSARDAVELGYRTIMLGDLCVGPRDGRHEATLTTFFRSFGDVRSVACMRELLK